MTENELAGNDMPWSDCKVAFDCSEVEAMWSAFYQPGALREQLPYGWKLDETDTSGARAVVVFRVEVPLSQEDGLIVLNLVSKAESAEEPGHDAKAKKKTAHEGAANERI